MVAATTGRGPVARFWDKTVALHDTRVMLTATRRPVTAGSRC